MSNDLKNNQCGFTLIELILVVGMITILTAISVPVMQSYRLENDMSSSADLIAVSLRRAQLLSQSAAADSAWSAHFEGSRITVFAGEDYVNRDAVHDEVLDLPPSVVLSGTAEINFEKLTGNTSPAQMVTISNYANSSINISVNEKGTVNY